MRRGEEPLEVAAGLIAAEGDVGPVAAEAAGGFGDEAEAGAERAVGGAEEADAAFHARAGAARLGLVDQARECRDAVSVGLHAGFMRVCAHGCLVAGDTAEDTQRRLVRPMGLVRAELVDGSRDRLYHIHTFCFPSIHCNRSLRRAPHAR